MMTQRPTMGSLRSSGNYRSPFRGPQSRPREANRTILRLEVNVPEQFDLRLAGGVIVVHADDFEAPRAGRRQMTQVFTGDCDKFPALIPINGGFGGLHVASGAGLDFDKAEDVLVPADQVDFAAPVGRAKVPGNHGVAVSPEIEVGVLFASPAGAEVF